MKGKRRCEFEAFDLQSLSRLGCDCIGYAPLAGRLSEAEFAKPDDGSLPKLRLARPDSSAA